MKKILFLLTLLLTFTVTNAQVGVNTAEPTETLDINGTLRIRDFKQAPANFQLLVVDSEGVVYKVSLSDLKIDCDCEDDDNDDDDKKCPTFSRESSNGSYLLFTTKNPIRNPQDTKTILGSTFKQSGTWIANNVHYYSYTRVSGKELDINKEFSVTFDKVCTYKK